MVDYNRKMLHLNKENVSFAYDKCTDIIENLQYYVNEYGKDCYIDTFSGYDGDTRYRLVQVRPETDDEMNARIEKEIEREKHLLNNEIAEFERLKKKFNG